VKSFTGSYPNKLILNMYDKLLPLLGKSIEDEEIKSLLKEWNIAYPKSINCSANYRTLKGKIEMHCIRLYFGMGGNSRHMKPMPASRANSYIAQFTMIEFTAKRKDGIPFNVRFDMTPEQLTKIMGTPKVTDVIGKSTVWRKNYTTEHELIVSDDLYSDGTSLRSITLTFVYEPELDTLEDYEKAGL
jgi:hypothetical protein